MRIILALDGSASSVQARDLVAGLTWPADTAITLVAAYQLPVNWYPAGPMVGDWITTTEEVVRTAAEQELAALAAPLNGRGWTIERRTILSRPADAILSTADAVDADLVVVGSRGRGRIQSMLLGSVSAEIADRARQSVLVVRSDRVTRLLVATDGSEGSASIPGVLDAWQAFRGVPAIALSVAPIDSPEFELMVSLYTLGSYPLEEQRKELLARHEGYAGEMARRLSDVGIQAEAALAKGDAADKVIRVARDRGADLVVAGSRGLRGLETVLLGSVARNVLWHAGLSVLIVRVAEEPA